MESSKNTTENKKLARGYVRVSTTRQVEEGVSLETQVKLIQKYCAYEELDLVKIYEDAGISGRNTTDRPKLQELLFDVKKDDYVIVCNLARLGRSTKDVVNIIHDFKVKGINFVCLDPRIDGSTPMGRAMIGMMSVLNELERENISTNTSINMKRLAAEGKLRGRSPFGYKFVGKDKDMEEVPEQQEVIQLIVQSYNAGMNMNKIAQHLNNSDRGPTLNLNKKTPTGDPKFYPETVKTILQNHGLIATDSKPVEQRIVSFHKVT